MDTIRELLHHKNQRIEFDRVLTRLSSLGVEALNSFITGFTGARSGLLYGSIVPGAGALETELVQGSFFTQRIETTKCVGIAQKKAIILTHDAGEVSTTLGVRKDVIRGRFLKTENFPKTFDQINELNGNEINPIVFNTNTEFSLVMDILKGNTSTGAPQDLSSSAASYTSPVDISSPLDLTGREYIRISLNNGTYQDIDLSSLAGSPTSVSVTQMRDAINAAFAGLATHDGTYLTLTATGGGDSIRFIVPIAGGDGTELVFGLDLSPDYMHLFERQYPYFKVAEIWVPDGAGAIVQADIYGPDRQKLWTAPADPNDENDSFNQPNVEELTELTVPLGAIIAVHKNVKITPSTDFWSPCDGVEALSGELFDPVVNVPDLTDDRFLMGATGAAATGGVNDGHKHDSGTLSGSLSGGSISGNTGDAGAHDHGVKGDNGSGGSGHNNVSTTWSSATDNSEPYVTLGVGNHNHDLSGASVSGSVSISGNAGSGAADGDAAGSNRPKYFTVDYYMRKK
jgi:hypothetical protein